MINGYENQAPIETVWKNVVKLPDTPAPTEWLFKTGIAYPTSSELVGEGAGAIRYCKFTIGRQPGTTTKSNQPITGAFGLNTSSTPFTTEF